MIEHETLRHRLQELEGESRAGLGRLAALERERRDVQATLLRIDGAMRVLRELLAPPAAPRAELAPGEHADAAE
jgi:hypothetical protein